MRKNLLIFTLIIALLLSACSLNAGAEAPFSLDAKLVYGEDTVNLEISGNTSARYGQIISVVVYEIESPDNALTVTPAADYPLADITKIVRMDEITAAYNGDYEAALSFEGVDDAKYFVIQVTGGGYKRGSTSASKLIYYENQETIDSVTLPAFKNASTEELDTLLKAKQLLLGYYCDSDYEEGKEDIASLFVTIRDEDYPENFTTINDVQDVLATVEVLREIRTNPAPSEMQLLAEANSEDLAYDFADSDYTENKEGIFEMAETIMSDSKNLPDSMTDVKRILRQSTGMVLLNDMDATQMTDTVKKYADVFGIDVEDYEEACEEYGENNVNMAFVERNFTDPAKVLEAYEECTDILKEDEEESSGGSGGSGGGDSGGGGGGSFGGGGSSTITKAEIDNDIIDAGNEEIAEKVNVTFGDLDENHWAYEPVAYLAEKGILNGMGDGSFAPDSAVTREQFVKIIVEAFNVEGVTTNAFTDVEKGRWSEKYILAAFENGIAGGMGNGIFAPEKPVTRQDAAVMLKRVCDKYGIELTNTEKAFSDDDKIASYAKDSVKALSGAGVINGFEDGTFRPENTLTRAQAAKMIYGLIK